MRQLGNNFLGRLDFFEQEKRAWLGVGRPQSLISTGLASRRPGEDGTNTGQLGTRQDRPGSLVCLPVVFLFWERWPAGICWSACQKRTAALRGANQEWPHLQMVAPMLALQVWSRPLCHHHAGLRALLTWRHWTNTYTCSDTSVVTAPPVVEDVPEDNACVPGYLKFFCIRGISGMYS